MTNFVLLFILLILTLTFILVTTYHSFLNRKCKLSTASTIIPFFSLSALIFGSALYFIPQDTLTERFLLAEIDGHYSKEEKNGTMHVNIYHEPSQTLGKILINKDNYTIEKTNKPSYVEYSLHGYKNMVLDALFGTLSHTSLTVYKNPINNMTATYSNGFLYPPGYSEETKEQNDKIVKEIEKLEKQLSGLDEEEQETENKEKEETKE